MDDTFQIYVNRVARMTLPEAYKSQAQHIQSSPKFQQQNGKIVAVPFPGYTVITPPMVDEDPQNLPFYEQLERFQQQVVATLPPGLLVPLPPSSFHLTLADLIWDSVYLHAKENPAFEGQLRDRIAQSFQECALQVKGAPPIYWQVLGINVMTRALGVCLAPKDEESYDRIIKLRRAIYQNSDLIGLGIEQQYHLTAHITLGYFADVNVVSDRDALGDTFSELTQSWQDTNSPQALWIHRAELRKFDDMTRYYRDAEMPVLKF